MSDSTSGENTVSNERLLNSFITLTKMITSLEDKLDALEHRMGSIGQRLYDIENPWYVLVGAKHPEYHPNAALIRLIKEKVTVLGFRTVDRLFDRDDPLVQRFIVINIDERLPPKSDSAPWPVFHIVRTSSIGMDLGIRISINSRQQEQKDATPDYFLYDCSERDPFKTFPKAFHAFHKSLTQDLDLKR